MQSHADSSRDEGLKLLSYCPLCEERSKPTQVRLLGSNGDTRLLHVTCNHCSNAILALVFVNQSGASSVGFVTDLTFEDAGHFLDCPTVSVDDVIFAHQWLQTEHPLCVLNGAD